MGSGGDAVLSREGERLRCIGHPPNDCWACRKTAFLLGFSITGLLPIGDIRQRVDGYSMKTIPTFVHGILDYVVGIALLLAPNLFGFADVGGAAVMVPRVIGVLIIGMALITRYELGLIKLLPMPAHLAVDYVVPLILAASPWLFGFSDLRANAWVPHVVVGLGSFLIAIMTEKEPRRQVAHHHA